MSIVPSGDHKGGAGWPRLLEVIRFGTVGAWSTALYLAVYAAAVFIGAPFAVAAGAGFLVSAVCGYSLHDRWTFRTNTPTDGGLARWMSLQATVLGLNIGALWALVTCAGIDVLGAQIILLPLIPATTYLLGRRLVFRAA